MLLEGKHENAAGVCHGNGCCTIFSEEQRLHRRFSWVIGREQNADLLMEQAQAIWEGRLRWGADDVAGKGGQLSLPFDEDRISSNCHARVNAENDPLRGRALHAPCVFL